MELKMYSLFDKTSEEFNAPFLMKNDKLAVKAVNTFIASKQGNVTADDFDLYCVGSFDTDGGLVSGQSIQFVDFKEKSNG